MMIPSHDGATSDCTVGNSWIKSIGYELTDRHWG